LEGQLAGGPTLVAFLQQIEIIQANLDGGATVVDSGMVVRTAQGGFAAASDVAVYRAGASDMAVTALAADAALAKVTVSDQ
jgi:hypothetical protein